MKPRRSLTTTEVKQVRRKASMKLLTITESLRATREPGLDPILDPGPRPQCDSIASKCASFCLEVTIC